MKNRIRRSTPDKLCYTRAEKIEEIICGISILGLIAAEITLMAAEITSKIGILFIVIIIVIYGALTFCGLRPLRVNFLFRPEEINERTLRFLRMGCILVKLLLCMATFSISLLTAFA